jgi:ABC-type uncharacterized transport system permease subunit
MKAESTISGIKWLKPAWDVRGWITVVAPLTLFALFLLMFGVNPLQLYASMVQSTFGDPYGFGEVVIKATPFILTALATALPAKAGMINVGGEGQLAFGALATTFAAVFLLPNAPSWIGLPALIICGAFGGALWAGIVGFLKTVGKLNETITSLLMNYIAYFIVGYFVHGILKDPKSFNWPFSPEIGEQLRLITFTLSSRAHVGIIIAIVLVIVVWYILDRTRVGYRIRVIGGNPLAAKRAGFKVSRQQLWILIAAGALAGIGGMIEITGIEGRLRPSTGMNYGYLGFLASWMAWNHPLALIGTAFIIAMISVAGNSMEMTSGLPASSVQILLALVLFSILAVGRRKKA